MPPSPARLPIVARPGSALAAKAVTPVDCVDASDPDTADATSHGSADRIAAPRLTAAQVSRDRPAPGTNALTTATHAANSRPVGVRPANAIQNTSDHTGPSPVRSRIVAAATQGRHP